MTDRMEKLIRAAAPKMPFSREIWPLNRALAGERILLDQTCRWRNHRRHRGRPLR